MKRSEYPSQKNYRENNPSVSFRLKIEDKARLDAIIKATGKPLSQWMTDFIHYKIDPNEEISELVERIDTLEEYINKSDTGEHFTVPCSVCGKPMYFSSKHSNWQTETYPKLIEAFGKSRHKKCKPK